MQLNKKLFSSAIIALLVLSVVAVAAPAFAMGTGSPWLTNPTSPLVGDKTSGAVGSVVQVVGAGANASAGPFNVVNVYLDSVTAASLLGSVASDSVGAYAINVTIPSAANGPHNIIVSDGVSPNAFSVFTVNSSLSRGTTTRALPGDSVTLTGNGFNASSAVTVTMVAPNGTTTVNVTATITTNATGSFTAVVTIPSTITAVDFSSSVWTINATTASASVFATATITIDYYVTVTPTSGPTGITVTIAGRIPANTAYSVNFGSAIGVFSGTSSATGTFTGTYTITGPIINGGSYAATVIWAVTNSRSATFTGAASPTITLGATSGVPGANVTISGAGFSASAAITLKMGTTVITVTTVTSSTSGGAFTAKQFTVPSVVAGTYVFEVVDQYGATTGTAYSFTVLAAPVTTIGLRASSYAQGDTLSFSIITTETSLGTVNVYVMDPAGRTQFSSAAWGAALTAAAADGTRYIQFQSQVNTVTGNYFTLPTDAQTGTWNWTITYLPASLGGATLVTATGLFTVTVKTTLADVNTKLDTITATLNQVNTTVNSNKAVLTTIDGNVVTIKTDVATIKTNLAALDAKVVSLQGSVATLSTSMGTVTASVNSLSASISSINSGVATVNTKLGTIQTSLSSLDAVLGVVAGDTATISTSLGTVTTSLASINPTLTSISNGIATITTDVGTLQGTVTSINSGVATVQTGVGTLQTNVGNLQTGVTSTESNTSGTSTLIYVAIVFALIAAIAAIASIFLMRQKIAG